MKAMPKMFQILSPVPWACLMPAAPPGARRRIAAALCRHRIALFCGSALRPRPGVHPENHRTRYQQRQNLTHHDPKIPLLACARITAQTRSVLKQNKDFLLIGERPMPSRARLTHGLVMVELVALPGQGAIGEHAHKDHHEFDAWSSLLCQVHARG